MQAPVSSVFGKFRFPKTLRCPAALVLLPHADLLVLTLCQYRSEAEVREHNEFRFMKIVDLETGEQIYELEHEIRSLDHPGFSCRVWLEVEDHAEGGDFTKTAESGGGEGECKTG